jgi:hypothetical protein
MLAKASKADDKMPPMADIKVFNLPELLLLMENAEKTAATSAKAGQEASKDYSEMGFFPASSSVQAVREVRGQHGTRARAMYRLAPF